jgi:hypothetical protein
LLTGELHADLERGKRRCRPDESHTPEQAVRKTLHEGVCRRTKRLWLPASRRGVRLSWTQGFDRAPPFPADAVRVNRIPAQSPALGQTGVILATVFGVSQYFIGFLHITERPAIPSPTVRMQLLGFAPVG